MGICSGVLAMVVGGGEGGWCCHGDGLCLMLSLWWNFG